MRATIAFGLGLLVAFGTIHASEARQRRWPMQEAQRCAECQQAPGPEGLRRSAYFDRQLCERCFTAERTRSRKEQEMYLLTRMYELTAPESGV